jgi:hypothetical protein
VLQPIEPVEPSIAMPFGCLLVLISCHQLRQEPARLVRIKQVDWLSFVVFVGS